MESDAEQMLQAGRHRIDCRGGGDGGRRIAAAFLVRAGLGVDGAHWNGAAGVRLAAHSVGKEREVTKMSVKMVCIKAPKLLGGLLRWLQNRKHRENP